MKHKKTNIRWTKEQWEDLFGYAHRTTRGQETQVEYWDSAQREVLSPAYWRNMNSVLASDINGRFEKFNKSKASRRKGPKLETDEVVLARARHHTQLQERVNERQATQKDSNRQVVIKLTGSLFLYSDGGWSFTAQ